MCPLGVSPSRECGGRFLLGRPDAARRRLEVLAIPTGPCLLPLVRCQSSSPDMSAANRALITVGAPIQRLMLRTGRGTLRLLWCFGYATVIRAVATFLRIASAEAVYLRGSFANGEPIYGLSDVDLVAVVGADRRRDTDQVRLRGRVGRFYAGTPAARGVVEVTVLTEPELQEACSTLVARCGTTTGLGPTAVSDSTARTAGGAMSAGATCLPLCLEAHPPTAGSGAGWSFSSFGSTRSAPAPIRQTRAPPTSARR
jgi:hypothetical protein